jgi:hypothetical protein
MEAHRSAQKEEEAQVRRGQHERIVDDMRRAFARERETWAAERRDLLDRIMYMADRPWAPPPVEGEIRPLPTAEAVDWPVVLPDQLTPDEVAELATANGDE